MICEKTGVDIMQLIKVSDELYPLPMSFDRVYQVVNENRVPIGLIYLSDLTDGSIYIEWLEILTVFRGMGYLRKLLQELKKICQDKVIRLSCTDDLLKKYLGVGCVDCGIDEFTENHLLSYE